MVDQRTPAYRFAFVVEQNLGHRTHYRNLQRYVAEDSGVEPTWLPLEYETQGRLYALPPLRNMSVRLSLKAWQALGRGRRARDWDAILYHTQTTSLLSPMVSGTSAVISLDATPANFDEVAEHYGHPTGGWPEQAKKAIYRWTFAHAAALITWSHWAKRSLERDYGVAGDKVSVIAPGVDLERWPLRPGRERIAATAERPVRLLFVGGDFKRKGGEVLLECFRSHLDDRCELHVVTESDVPAGRNLHVHHGVTPNSERLLRLYADSDIFVFPTLADCFAQVVPEAMAAGLPVITTRVGATPEIVREGETGLLVQPGDAAMLGRAIGTLLERPELRASMGDAGRRVVEVECDVRRNARLVVDVLKAASTLGRSATRGRAVARQDLRRRSLEPRGAKPRDGVGAGSTRSE